MEISTHELYNEFVGKENVITYKGKINQKILLALVGNHERILNKMSVGKSAKRNIIIAFVETVQNMINYCTLEDGCFVNSEFHPNKWILKSSNYINPDDYESLNTVLNNIKTLKAEDIKKEFYTKLKNDSIKNNTSAAGLGLLLTEMVTKGEVSYYFFKRKDETISFNQTITILF
jgi:hypothetical protein